LPQQFYYFYALQQWQIRNPQSAIRNPVVCVPSGNFGNICAGILAHISGLPVEKFIAATNANDVIPNFMQSGKMEEKSSVATLSNAMDVAKPSNFVRILEIFDNDYLNLKEKMESVSISDEVTANTMREVFEKYNYILDPHGAVGFRALSDYLSKNEGEGFFLETAHPIKFDSVEQIIGTFGEIPESVKELYEKEKQSIEIKANYEDLKDLLMSKV
jgi:threonine synthase